MTRQEREAFEHETAAFMYPYMAAAILSAVAFQMVGMNEFAAFLLSLPVGVLVGSICVRHVMARRRCVSV